MSESKKACEIVGTTEDMKRLLVAGGMLTLDDEPYEYDFSPDRDKPPAPPEPQDTISTLRAELSQAKEELELSQKVEADVYMALEAAGCPHSEDVPGERHPRWLNSRKQIEWIAAELSQATALLREYRASHISGGGMMCFMCTLSLGDDSDSTDCPLCIKVDALLEPHPSSLLP